MQDDFDELEEGSVFWEYKTYTNPPKPKMSAVIAMTWDGEMLVSGLINTSPYFPEGNPLRDYQLKLLQSKYPEFLAHDSYLSTSSLECQNVAATEREIARNPKNNIVGKLDDDDLKEAKRLAENCEETIPAIKKRFFG